MGNFIYKFINSKDEIIYIGKTIRLHVRMKSEHFTSNGHLPQKCYDETVKIYCSKLNNKDEMSIYERYYINLYNPKYNQQYNNNSTFNFTLPDLKWCEYNENLFKIKKDGNEKLKKDKAENNKNIKEINYYTASGKPNAHKKKIVKNLIRSKIKEFRIIHENKIDKLLLNISKKKENDIR